MSGAMIKVGELRTYSRRVNLLAKVVERLEEREVVSRSNGRTHRLVELLVGDDTATVLLTLWDENVDRFDVGDVIQIQNGYANLFRGSLRLNVGRYGEVEKVDEGVGEVDIENNLSKKVYGDRYRQPQRGWRRY